MTKTISELFNEEETAYLRDHCATMTIKQMAKQIRRRGEDVRRFLHYKGFKTLALLRRERRPEVDRIVAEEYPHYSEGEIVARHPDIITEGQVKASVLRQGLEHTQETIERLRREQRERGTQSLARMRDTESEAHRKWRYALSAGKREKLRKMNLTRLMLGEKPIGKLLLYDKHTKRMLKTRGKLARVYNYFIDDEPDISPFMKNTLYYDKETRRLKKRYKNSDFGTEAYFTRKYGIRFVAAEDYTETDAEMCGQGS